MIGVHQRFEPWLPDVITQASSIGADTFQIFIRNNRNMRRRDITIDEVEAFNKAVLKSPIHTYVVHAPYSMNPVTDEEERRNRYLTIVKSDLNLIKNLRGRVFYVLHPGSSKYLDTRSALRNLSEFLRALEPYRGNVRIAVEYMAGAGTQLLCTIDQVVTLHAMCYDLPDFCITFDTCHVWASGTEISTAWRYLAEKVGVVHLNGSKTIFGSRVDRHGSLVGSLIPSDELLAFAREVPPTIPIVLETPGETIDQDFTWLKNHL